VPPVTQPPACQRLAPAAAPAPPPASGRPLHGGGDGPTTVAAGIIVMDESLIDPVPNALAVRDGPAVATGNASPVTVDLTSPTAATVRLPDPQPEEPPSVGPRVTAEPSTPGTNRRWLRSTKRHRMWRHAPDAALALVVAAVVLLGIRRPGQPIDVRGVTLIAVGAMSLTWRRTSPIAVLIITTACYGAYQLAHNPHTSLSLFVIIALYTVASRYPAFIAAAASSVLVISAIGAAVVRGRSAGADFDDHLVAYLLCIGAACSLGYGAQLTRTRTELLRQQALRLALEHAEHEQWVVQETLTRIARELHDVVAHQLSLVTALAAGADRVIATDPARARQALSSIEAAGRDALTEMRWLLRVLRHGADVVSLAPQPTLEQLPGLVARAEQAGLRASLRVHGDVRPLPAGVELCAYRIVQEALTNVLKHAGATGVQVVVTYTLAVLLLSVCDDGRGIAANEPSGHGLVGMGERASLVGGQLTVENDASGGVRVCARLPLTTEVACPSE
jgi:signal transduction histidine kinase